MDIIRNSWNKQGEPPQKVSIRNGFDPPVSSAQPDLQVVIDVFRASTTTLALLDVGVKELIIANELEIIKKFHSDGYNVISEVFGLGVDNSPTLVLKGNYQGEKTLLKTANLTTSIAENFKTTRMLIAGFNNVIAVADCLRKQPVEWIEIIPAGLMKPKKENPEDTECANLLSSLILGKDYEVDWKAIQNRIEEKITETDRPQFYIDDLSHALRVGISTVVPEVRKLDNNSFQVLRL